MVLQTSSATHVELVVESVESIHIHDPVAFVGPVGHISVHVPADVSQYCPDVQEFVVLPSVHAHAALFIPDVKGHASVHVPVVVLHYCPDVQAFDALLPSVHVHAELFIPDDVGHAVLHVPAVALHNSPDEQLAPPEPHVQLPDAITKSVHDEQIGRAHV